jgi:hypothetical protein
MNFVEQLRRRVGPNVSPENAAAAGWDMQRLQRFTIAGPGPGPEGALRLARRLGMAVPDDIVEAPIAARAAAGAA